jgi:tetrahydromethanopterin S-methyltransferase subunit A
MGLITPTGLEPYTYNLDQETLDKFNALIKPPPPIDEEDVARVVKTVTAAFDISCALDEYQTAFMEFVAAVEDAMDQEIVQSQNTEDVDYEDVTLKRLPCPAN